MSASPPAITDLLLELRQDPGAIDRLVPLVYDQLLHLAHRQRFSWRADAAPGTTSLVHEAYLKLVDQTRVDFASRAQFFALAARVMRNILVDNSRWHARQKRDGGVRVPLDEGTLVSAARSDELLALDRVLEELLGSDERLARIVECRIFGGLTIEETGEALGLSASTVKRGFNLARAWLYGRLGEPPSHTPTARPGAAAE